MSARKLLLIDATNLGHTLFSNPPANSAIADRS